MSTVSAELKASMTVIYELQDFGMEFLSIKSWPQAADKILTDLNNDSVILDEGVLPINVEVCLGNTGLAIAAKHRYSENAMKG